MPAIPPFAVLAPAAAVTCAFARTLCRRERRARVRRAHAIATRTLRAFFAARCLDSPPSTHDDDDAACRYSVANNMFARYLWQTAARMNMTR